MERISIHALCEEGDVSRPAGSSSRPLFLSTPSARRATKNLIVVNTYGIFLSTPSARRATYADHVRDAQLQISIHALCEEGDSMAFSLQGHAGNFYPRPLRGGRRLSIMFIMSDSLFLSTPSARRATAKTETKSLFSNKLYNILHEFRRALIYNGSKNDPNHAK